MLSPVASLTRRGYRQPPYNILTFPTHERYESNLAQTGHNFYAWRQPDIKDWNATYAPVPENYILLAGQFPPGVQFDFILSQNKFGQFQVAHQLSEQLHLPLISLEHTLPVEQWPQEKKDYLRKMRGHINVFISEYSQKKWGFEGEDSIVVHHGINTEVFRPYEAVERKPVILSVVNDWINRDYFCGYSFWRSATANIPKSQLRVIGATPGLSEPAKSVDELVYEYRSCQIFCNTSLVSPVPTALLEAMSCGVACISTATCMIPEIIQHGKNGILVNSPEEMSQQLRRLLNEPDLCRELGNNARRTILERFSLESFVDKWNGVFDAAAATIYGV